MGGDDYNLNRRELGGEQTGFQVLSDLLVLLTESGCRPRETEAETRAPTRQGSLPWALGHLGQLKRESAA